MREPAVETAGQHGWQKKSGRRAEPMSCHYHCIPLLSPVPPFLSVPLPIPTEQERAVLLLVWSCTCSDGEHQQLLSTILWQLWSTWVSSADALVWFSSLLPICCLPGSLKIYPPFHTLLAMADVLKRYWRREI